MSFSMTSRPWTSMVTKATILRRWSLVRLPRIISENLLSIETYGDEMTVRVRVWYHVQSHQTAITNTTALLSVAWQVRGITQHKRLCASLRMHVLPVSSWSSSKPFCPLVPWYYSALYYSHWSTGFDWKWSLTTRKQNAVPHVPHL